MASKDSALSRLKNLYSPKATTRIQAEIPKSSNNTALSKLYNTYKPSNTLVELANMRAGKKAVSSMLVPDLRPLRQADTSYLESKNYGLDNLAKNVLESQTPREYDRALLAYQDRLDELTPENTNRAPYYNPETDGPRTSTRKTEEELLDAREDLLMKERRAAEHVASVGYQENDPVLDQLNREVASAENLVNQRNEAYRKALEEKFIYNYGTKNDGSAARSPYYDPQTGRARRSDEEVQQELLDAKEDLLLKERQAAEHVASVGYQDGDMEKQRLDAQAEAARERVQALENELSYLRTDGFELELQAQRAALEAVRQNPDYGTDAPASSDGSLADREIAAALQNPSLGNLLMSETFTSAQPMSLLIAYMTEDERRTAFYYAQKGEYDKMREYIDTISREVNARRSNFTQQKLYDYSEKYPGAAVVIRALSGYGNVGAVAETARQTIENAITGEYEPIDYNRWAFSAPQIRDTTTTSILDGIESPVAQFLVQTGLSMTDFLAMAPAGSAALPLMALNASGDEAYNLAVQGVSPEKVLALAAITGAIEAATEKLPLENLLRVFKGGKTGVKAFIENSLKQAGTEASEELISEYAGTIAENAILGNDSEMNQYIEKLVSDGTNRHEAERQAFGEFYLKNPALAAAGGALSGGIMGAGGAVAGGAFNGRQGGTASPGIQNNTDTDLVIDMMVSPEARAQVEQAAPTLGNPADNAGESSVTTPYTEEEAANIRKEAKTFRNIIAGIDTSVRNFFYTWRNGRKSNQGEKLEKLYLGKLSQDSLAAIEKILGYEVRQRDVIITNDDVKHIHNQHPTLPEWAIEAIPAVIANPDSIRAGHTGSGKNYGKTGIVMTKQMPNGQVVTIQFDNPGRETMQITTIYIKESATSEATAGIPAAARTPTASEPALSDQIVPQQAQMVNGTGAQYPANATNGPASASSETADTAAPVYSGPSIPQAGRSVNTEGDGLGAMDARFPYVERESQMNATRSVLSPEEWNMPGFRPEDNRHVVLSNAAARETAEQRLQMDYEGEVEYLRNKESWDAGDNTMAQYVLRRMREKAASITGGVQKENAYNEYREFYQLTRSRRSEQGQALQSNAQFARDPEAIVGDAAVAIEQAKGTKKRLTRQELNAVMSDLEKQRNDAIRVIQNAIGSFSESGEGNRKSVQLGWVDALAKDLAAKAESYVNPRSPRSRTAYETILSDLVSFMNQYVDRKSTAKKRTAAQRLSDFFNNRSEYARAWNQARDQLKRTQSAESLDRLEDFIYGTIDYNATGTDAVMLSALAEAAMQNDIDLRQRIVRGNYDYNGLVDDISNTLIENTGATDSDAQIIRNAAKRFINETADTDRAQSYVRGDFRRIMKDMGTSISKVLLMGAQDKSALIDNITRTLIQDYNISEAGAVNAAQQMTDYFYSLLKESATKRLESLFKDRPSSKPKSARKILEELVNLGAFTDPSFMRPAMSKAFGVDMPDDISILDKISDLAVRYQSAADANNVEALQGIIREAAQIRHTTGMFSDDLSKTMEWALREVSKDVDFLKDLALSSIRNIAADQTAPSAGEVVLSLRRMYMLSKVSTYMRNIISNNVFDPMDTISRNISVPLDILLSKFTGTRSVAIDRGAFSRAKWQGSKQALAKSLLEVGLDIGTTENGRWEGMSKRTFRMSGNVLERFFSTLQKNISYALVTTDQIQKGGIEAEVQRGLDRLYEQGKITRYDPETASRVTDDSLRTGGQTEALYRTFQDENKLTRTVLDVRKAFNNLNVGGVGAGDLLIPFAQVPANLGARALEYSPAGLIKSGVDLVNVLKKAKEGTLTAAEQAKAVQGIGRGLNGTAVIAIATVAALSGAIRVLGVGDDDEDKTFLDKMMGQYNTQLNLSALGRILTGGSGEWQDGDTLINIDYLDPMNAMFTTGALIAEDAEAGDADLLTILEDSVAGAFQSVIDLPVMTAIQDFSNAYTYADADSDVGKVLRASAETLLNQASSFIPNIIAGIAQGTDPYQRDQYTSDSLLGRTWDSIKARIPGLRETLPEKLDSWGEPMETEGGVLGFLNSTILPGYIQHYNQDDLSLELQRLSDESGESVYPRKSAPSSVTFDGETYHMSSEEKRLYQQVYGQTAQTLMGQLADSEAYGSLSDEERASLMGTILDYAADEAKKTVLEGRGLDYEGDMDEKVEALENAGLNFTQYLLVREAYKQISGADMDSGQKTVEFTRWVGSQGFTPAEEDAVLDNFKYFNMVPANANTYNKLVDANLDEEDAYNLNSALSALEPLPGESQVSSLQKYQAILDAGLSTPDEMAALRVVMNDSTYEKLSVVNRSFGVTPESFVQFQAAVPKYDADGNGSLKQNELTQAVNSVPGLSQAERAALWQCYNKSWSYKNNPFDPNVGREVRGILNPDD